MKRDTSKILVNQFWQISDMRSCYNTMQIANMMLLMNKVLDYYYEDSLHAADVMQLCSFWSDSCFVWLVIYLFFDATAYFKTYF